MKQNEEKPEGGFAWELESVTRCITEEASYTKKIDSRTIVQSTAQWHCHVLYNSNDIQNRENCLIGPTYFGRVPHDLQLCGNKTFPRLLDECVFFCPADTNVPSLGHTQRSKHERTLPMFFRFPRLTTHVPPSRAKEVSIHKSQLCDVTTGVLTVFENCWKQRRIFGSLKNQKIRRSNPRDVSRKSSDVQR